MQKEKKSQIFLNRRAFLSWFSASAGFYCLKFVLGALFLPAFGMAEDGRLSPPIHGGTSGPNYIPVEEFRKLLNALAKKSDAIDRANNRQLSPEQKKQQLEEERRVLQSIIESNGYKLMAPSNFRIKNIR